MMKSAWHRIERAQNVSDTKIDKQNKTFSDFRSISVSVRLFYLTEKSTQGALALTPATPSVLHVKLDFVAKFIPNSSELHI